MATASETYKKQRDNHKWERRWDTFCAWVKAIFTIVLIVALAFGIIFGIVFTFAPPMCDGQTSQIGYPHRWSLAGNCQIEVVDGKWIPLDNYHYNESRP